MLNVAWLSSISSALVVADRAEFQIGVGKLAENLRGGLRHLRLHGQQMFFLFAQRMRPESQQPLQEQTIAVQAGIGQKLLHLGRGNGQDFRPDVTGGLGCLTGGMQVPALHPLIFAVGGIFGGFQKGISAQPFAGAVELLVELQTFGQRIRAFGQVALEFRITGDLLFPGQKGCFPGPVAGKQAAQVPGVGGFDFIARGKTFHR